VITGNHMTVGLSAVILKPSKNYKGMLISPNNFQK